MATTTVIHDVPPYLKVYKDGTVQRFIGTETTPPTDPDPQTGVSSYDVVLSPAVSARIYRPSHCLRKNLPLVIYFHGGAFCISSTADPLYQAMLNLFVKQAQILLVSVNYRLAPEHPLPAAYDDSWAALKWVAAAGDPRIAELADFDRVFLAGDSAGANIVHHMAIRAGLESPGLEISGVVMMHPYFWGKSPVGAETESMEFKLLVDNWWLFVCPSDKGCDDPNINPFADGAPGVSGLGCGKALVFVAGNDILRERGRRYFRALSNDWVGKAELYETEGEDHVFVVLDPTTENATKLIKKMSDFVNTN